MKRRIAIAQPAQFGARTNFRFAFVLMAGEEALPLELHRRAWRSTTYRQVQKLDREISQCLPE